MIILFIKKYYRSAAILLTALSVHLLTIRLVWANNHNKGGTTSDPSNISSGGGSLGDTAGESDGALGDPSSGLVNPLGGGVTDLTTFINKILEGVLTIGVPVVALAIIYTGFLFVKAQGNPQELTKAKDALMWTIIGAAIVLGSFVLAESIAGTIDEIVKSGS